MMPVVPTVKINVNLIIRVPKSSVQKYRYITEFSVSGQAEIKVQDCRNQVLLSHFLIKVKSSLIKTINISNLKVSSCFHLERVIISLNYKCPPWNCQAQGLGPGPSNCCLPTTATEKIQRNSLSRTMATNFQSSLAFPFSISSFDKAAIYLNIKQIQMET